jgi:hypothetical protein
MPRIVPNARAGLAHATASAMPKQIRGAKNVNR